VAELTPALLDWNRRLVGGVAGRPLDDPRTHVHIGDCVQRIQEAKSAYDAILLDIDNGPSSMVHEANHRLYGYKGIALCRDALRQGGCLAVWSAHHDVAYLERLKKAGLDAESVVVPARGADGGLKHVLFLAVKREVRPGGRGRPGPKAGVAAEDRKAGARKGAGKGAGKSPAPRRSPPGGVRSPR